MTVFKPEASSPRDGVEYSFGSFRLRRDGTLLQEMDQVRLPPKELAILRLLVANAGQIVSAEQLRLSAWGDVHVSVDSLHRCVSSLRALLDSQDCIQTAYKRGYRFTLAVKQTRPEPQGDGENERRTIRTIRPLPRLSILPFAIADGVPEFLGAGIAEETMLRLAHTPSPVVDLMARDSVFHLVANGATAREVGITLGADLTLTGNITAHPLYFRLRTEMIHVADAVQLWVEDFLIARNLMAEADARVAQCITARICNTLAASIAPGLAPGIASVSAMAVHATSVPIELPGSIRHGLIQSGSIRPSSIQVGPGRRSEAYIVYLQACAQWNTFERHNMQEAIRGFQHALELDADLLEARMHLVHGYLTQSSYGYMRADIATELAREHAESALALAPDGQTMYPALGWIHFHHDRDFDAAADAFARPQHPGYDRWTVIYRVKFALGQGRFSEAIALLRSALDADPYSPVMHGRLAWALHLAGEPHAALEQAKRAAGLFPGHLGAMFFCAIVFAAAGKSGDSGGELAVRATALATGLIQSFPSLDAGYGTLAYCQARQGSLREARAVLDRQQWLSRERFVMRTFHVPALVELGEFEAAIEALVTAEEQHCPWLFELLHDPRLLPLHGKPEFQRLSRISRQVEAPTSR